MTSLAVLLCFGLLFVPSWLWLSLMLWPSWIGRHGPPCGRHGLILGPLSFVDVIAVAVMDLAVIVLHVAVMVCGRHRRSPPHVG